MVAQVLWPDTRVVAGCPGTVVLHMYAVVGGPGAVVGRNLSLIKPNLMMCLKPK